jgi:hypothetical protein
MPETGLWTDGAVRRGSPQGYGLNQRSSVAGRPQTTLGERTAQPSLSIGRVSQPSMFVSIDDDSIAAEIERLLRDLQAGRRRSSVSPAAARLESVISRGHSWGHGWGRNGATHRWGTYD